MRCTGVRERIDRLNSRDDLASKPELAFHAGVLPGLRGGPPPPSRPHHPPREAENPPKPSDLAARVLSRLDDPSALRTPVWRWAAVAACALAALALGFYFGQFSAGSAPANDSMASTYQAAFTGQTANSAELAYLEAGSRDSAGVPARNAP